MSSELLFCIFFVSVCLTECEGITHWNDNEKNLIGEEERRGVNVKENIENDQSKSETKKRGLWIIGQANKHPHSSGYESTGIGSGYQGYGGHTGEEGYTGHTGAGGYDGYSGAGGSTGVGGYGFTGSGYSYENSVGYHKGPSFSHGYGHTGGTSFLGYGNTGYDHSGNGADYGHSGSEYGETGHGLSHGNDAYKKLALKKILIPLAGLALLGAAAALSTSPVLLQLGTLSGRKRRSTFEKTYQDVYPINPKIRPDFTN